MGKKAISLYKHKVRKEINIEGNVLLQKKSWIVYPGDQWKYVFDFFIAMLTLYYCVVIPYRIGFEPHVEEY